MADKQKPEANKSRRCAYCGAEAPLVWVHGHGQCARCGINVQECCQGEACERGLGTGSKA
jgi:hypothetical protein